jgi:predicted nucleic acid-binding protein
VIIVVDTNIVFSGLLNPNGKIGDLLLNSTESFDFFAPSFILDELKDHHNKLIKISKLPGYELEFLKRILLKKIELIDLEILPR